MYNLFQLKYLGQVQCHISQLDSQHHNQLEQQRHCKNVRPRSWEWSIRNLIQWVYFLYMKLLLSNQEQNSMHLT